MQRTISLILIFSFLLIFSPTHAIEKFYTYYDKGIKFMEKGEWERAIEEFKSAISLGFEDAKRKRTYGTRFIKYYPHRDIGICFYNLGEFSEAMGELQLSYAYKKEKKTKQYIDKLSYKGKQLDLKDDFIKKQEQQEEQEDLARRQQEMEEQRIKEEEIARKQKEIEDEKNKLAKEKKVKEKKELKKMEQEIARKNKELEAERAKLDKLKEQRSEVSKLPVGALTYDPSKVTQVGSRLSVAVLPFGGNDEAKDLTDSVTEKLIIQLVNLRRFRVIERSALDKIMEEQKLGLTGFVDEETAIKVGKLAGADVIILGNINMQVGFVKVSARGIDTETSVLIVAKEADSGNTNIETIENLVEQVAIDIYNDLPLVEGIVMEVEEDQIILSIGSNVGVRKGTKCVAYKEGKKYYHPVTKEVLGKNVTPLGELIVVQVQEKMSIAKPIGTISPIEIEDKVVVK
jgi:TolB-like protein